MHALRRFSQRFAPMLASRRRGSIGLELGHSALHFVQLGCAANQEVFLHARSSVPFVLSDLAERAHADALASAVRGARQSGGFDGHNAVVAMPAGQFRTYSVNYRPHADQPEALTIANLMDERLDGPLSDYVIDYVPVRATARDAERLAIVAVSKRTDVMALLHALHAGGLFVQALEIAPVALRRLANLITAHSTDMTMILNTGRQRSYLTLLSGRRLLLDQAIDVGENDLLANLATALDLLPEQAGKLLLRTGLHPASGYPQDGHLEGETGMFNTLLEILRPALLELVDQTDQAFMYAAAQTRGAGDARILLLGALARWPGCDEVLSSMTNLPVISLPDAVSAFAGIPEACSATTLPRPEYAVASGLALRGLIDGQ